MKSPIARTDERLVPEQVESKTQYLIYLRHLFAYEFVRDTIAPDSTVLEIGCGSGYGTNLLSQSVGRIIGVDVDASAVIHAAVRSASANCTFALYDGRILPWDRDTFDAVISIQVIEHVRDDGSFVAEAHRVLRPKGMFILTTPNRTYRLREGQRPWNRFHVREYYPHELENVLREKFRDVTVWGVDAKEEVRRIELERGRRHKNRLMVVPRAAAKLMPERTRKTLLRMFERFLCRQPGLVEDREFVGQYSVKDFHLLKDNVSASLDLVGICRK